MKTKLLIFLVSLGFQVLSQDDGIFTTRYWNYRYALRGDDIDPSFRDWEPGFLEVAPCRGCSQPMRARYRFLHDANVNPVNAAGPCNNTNFIGIERTNTLNYWELNNTRQNVPSDRAHGPNNTNTWFGTRDGVLLWADVPTDMGKYFILLATEMALLISDANRYTGVTTLNQLETQNFNLAAQIRMTYHEMSMAVRAMDILDGDSDDMYGGTTGNSADGIFIRDDVPPNFADDGKFGRAEFLTNNYWTNTTNRYHRGNSFSNVMSAYTAAGQNGGCGAALEISKDQFLKIMIGWIYAKQGMAIYKAKFSDPDNLYQRIDDILDRSIWAVFPSYSTQQPGGTACNASAMVAYSPMIWDVWNKFTSGNFVPAAFLHQLVLGQPLVFGQKLLYTAEYPVVSLAGLEFLGQNFNHEMFGFACISGDYAPMYLIPNSLHKFGCHLGKYNKKELEYEINYLSESLRNTIHGGGGLSIGGALPAIRFRWFPTQDYRDFMNRWNFCDCNHGTRSWFNTADNHNRIEEKNGIDYMIAHNLYLIQNGTPLRVDAANNVATNMVNLYNRRIEGTFPRSITVPTKIYNNSFPPSYTISNCTYTYGTNQTPAVIQSANSIDARNCIFDPNSRARLRAPHIELSPGFDARFGTVCEVQENQRMECTPYTQVVGVGNCPSIGLKITESTPIYKTEKLKAVSIFPNPTENDATIKLTNYDKTTINIYIYNMLGREMMRFSNIEIIDDEQNYYMNLERLNNGIYIVKIKQGDYSTSLKLEKR